MLSVDMNPHTTRRLRIIGWSLIAMLLLLPLIAMQFTSEVNWTASDFLFAAIVFGLAGGTLELGARVSTQTAYRLGALLAVAGCFLIVWISMAVGIIGESDDPRNLIYFALVAIAAIGSYATHGEAAGLKRTFGALTAVQLLVAVLHYGPSRLAVPIDLFFALLWGTSALLFAAAHRSERGAEGTGA